MIFPFSVLYSIVVLLFYVILLFYTAGDGLPDVEMRKGEGQADVQQQHVSWNLCDGVQVVD